MELLIDGLTKTFQGAAAVDHVTYTMKNGVYGLLGLNGAGKTTLMRMLCTLLKPSDGRIVCNGEDILSGSYGERLSVVYCVDQRGT